MIKGLFLYSQAFKNCKRLWPMAVQRFCMAGQILQANILKSFMTKGT